MSVTAPDFINVGVTYRRLDVWTSKGWLIPEAGSNPGSGNKRRYPRSELRVAELIVRLTDAGVAVEVAAWMARNRVEGAAALRGLADTVEAVAA